MNYINLPKPHGWLLWRGKKKAIANDAPLPGDKLLVVSGDEAYGYVTLASPVAVNVSEFERLEEEHLVRREDRKLYWPDADKFYLHRLKEWTPFDSTKAVKLDNGQAELLESEPLTDEQLELIKQVERLPKTLVLLDEAVTLCDGKAVYCDGVSPDKLAPILDVTLDGVKSADELAVYQLALVRIPRLSFKQKKSDTESKEEVKAMPYKIVNNHPDCDDDKPYAVVNTETDESKGCSASEDMAKEHMAALMANEGKSLKELITEARKCYNEGMPMPVMMNGPVTFAELQAIEEAQEQAQEAHELTYQFQMLSSNILSSDMEDKAAALSALASEYGGLVSQAVKSADAEEDTKAIEVEMVAWLEEWKEYAVMV